MKNGEYIYVPKWLLIFGIIVLIIIGVCSFFTIKDTIKLHANRKELKNIVDAEMQKYYSAIRKNDLKADSIINEINQDRSLRGLPIYDVKIRTIYSADDKHEDYWDFDQWYFKQTYSYGACRFTDKDSFFAEGILFYLHQPEIVAPIKIHILADEYIGYVEDIWECFHIKFREKD